MNTEIRPKTCPKTCLTFITLLANNNDFTHLVKTRRIIRCAQQKCQEIHLNDHRANLSDESACLRRLALHESKALAVPYPARKRYFNGKVVNHEQTCCKMRRVCAPEF